MRHPREKSILGIQLSSHRSAYSDNNPLPKKNNSALLQEDMYDGQKLEILLLLQNYEYVKRRNSSSGEKNQDMFVKHKCP